MADVRSQLLAWWDLGVDSLGLVEFLFDGRSAVRRMADVPELVPVAEVIYFKADSKYVTARTQAREFLLEESLSQLESEFGDRFLRLHRNCLAARKAIAGYERELDSSDADAEAHWRVLLHGVPERLPVSRRQWPQVKAAVAG